MTWLRHALWPLGLAVIASVLIVIGENPATTYGGTVTAGSFLETAAAVGLLLAAAVDAWPLRGVLLALLGLAWLVPELAGWLTARSEIRTGADATRAIVLLTTALLALIVLARRPDRDGPTTGRGTLPAVSAMCVAAAFAVTVRLALVDPFMDAGCWQNCEPNPLARNGFDPAARIILIGASVIIGAGLARAVMRRRPSHFDVAPVLALAAILTVLDGAAIARPSPASSTGVAFFFLAQTAALAVAARLVAQRYKDWRLRSRLTELADRLLAAPVPGGLVPALRTATGDPSLRADYWVPERCHYVDVDGGFVSAAIAPEEWATPVTRRGELLGRLVHGRGVDNDRIERAFGAALRLSLENERLRAATLAELHELRSSRMRIVEHAANERRRLERNLHDGAQQRVMALALLTRTLTSRVSDPESTALAQRADKLAKAVLVELRRVARGIYPVVLTDAGLGGAVLDLAQSSRDVAVVIGELPTSRYPDRVEATALLVISAALEHARVRKAGQLKVSALESDKVLRVIATDDAPGEAEGLPTAVADQVAAVGGSLAVRTTVTGTECRVELPCAS